MLAPLPLSWALACAAALAQWRATVPPARTLTGVPFCRQEKRNWCGPAALASVLGYYQRPANQAEIAKQVYLSNEGALNLDLKLYARRLGLAGESSTGQLWSLKSAIASGAPVICQVRWRGLLQQYYHYLVVYGYDDQRRVIYAHAGTAGAQKIAYRSFDHEWAKAGRWMLVIRGEK